ncbi:DUF3042 family protein [Lactococcus sp. DD01]|uniref:DUF3042 family protein n=1 Tax=Lactococcus sp. DD01 TaxID=1776443 RepID=UPI0007941203|nr:DUF3042 family protein [Lactococcus sp. DD01]KXT59264.1 hypothetical protein LACDD01_02179 [Lactococcus sp. DD01]
MNKKFISGVITGNLVTLVSLITAGAIYKKRVVAPIEQKMDFMEDNRKKANRKRIAH